MQETTNNLPIFVTPRYSNDETVTRIQFKKDNEFDDDETIVGCAIYIDSDDKFADYNGLYIGKGPTSHQYLISSIRYNVDSKFPTCDGIFKTKEYVYGFYTNKHRFINRKEAIWLISRNEIKTAVPVSKLSHITGVLSSDIWGESGAYNEIKTIQPARSLVTEEPRSEIPIPSKLGHITTSLSPRPRDANGKVVPKKASEMMAEKRLKKLIRKFAPPR